MTDVHAEIAKTVLGPRFVLTGAEEKLIEKFRDCEKAALKEVNLGDTVGRSFSFPLNDGSGGQIIISVSATIDSGRRIVKSPQLAAPYGLSAES